MVLLAPPTPRALLSMVGGLNCLLSGMVYISPCELSVVRHASAGGSWVHPMVPQGIL